MNPFNYQKRSVEFLGVLSVGRDKLKVYYLKSQKQPHQVPSREMQQAWLEQGIGVDDFPSDHHVGFAIFHHADDGVYLLISTWCDANMMRHRVFSIDDAGKLHSLEQTKIIACVWELEVMFYERNAWITQVMVSEMLEPDNVQRYLAEGYNGWV
ncbi:conserved hypothetical protein [Dickeya chrysanthemi Ech1591]|uniref:Uncharacterized protein n=1 Tax=Dickeya chrysanthemi (strain Ech1591) TaxID=561229 RepID=C6CLH0_DICC1|nr:hypothetical protein [Dickeya chrysanthemi]ACT08473.1 conserved hypothetical protein [Dickeya chrysanthemi Ech1591]